MTMRSLPGLRSDPRDTSNITLSIRSSELSRELRGGFQICSGERGREFNCIASTGLFPFALMHIMLCYYLESSGVYQ